MAYHKWSKKEEDFLLNNYDKLSRKDLIDGLNLTISQIRFKLKQLNIFIPDKKQWVSDEISLLKTTYNSKDPKELEQIFNRSWAHIQQKARSLGIKVDKKLWDDRISKALLDRKSSKYTLNESFFDNWSSEMAYILGWFYSDGHLGIRTDRSSKYKSARIKIDCKDEYILYDINQMMNSNYPVYKYGDDVVLVISNQKVCNDLETLGVIPGKKAKKLKCPDIPNEYIASFIKGLMDGDGSVEYGRHCRINIYASSQEFSYGIKMLLSKVNIESKLYCSKSRGKNEYTIRVSKQKDIYNLAMIMYVDDVGLKRKQILINNICNRYIRRKNAGTEKAILLFEEIL